MDLANLGLCQMRLGQTDLAVRTLSAAVELDPELTFAKEQLRQLLDGDAGTKK